MKVLKILFVSLITLYSVAIFADPPMGVGHGKAGLNSIVGGAEPPGLQGKGYPHGLSKEGKVPYGWSKGKKKGWYKIHGHDYYFDGKHLFQGHHED